MVRFLQQSCKSREREKQFQDDEIAVETRFRPLPWRSLNFVCRATKIP